LGSGFHHSGRSFKVKSRGYTWEDTPLGETLGRFSGQRPGMELTLPSIPFSITKNHPKGYN